MTNISLTDALDVERNEIRIQLKDTPPAVVMDREATSLSIFVDEDDEVVAVVIRLDREESDEWADDDQ